MKTQALLDRIAIQNTSAKVRAFKSMYWAPRWTSINLSVFEAAHPITLPYYDDQNVSIDLRNTGITPGQPTNTN